MCLHTNYYTKGTVYSRCKRQSHVDNNLITRRNPKHNCVLAGNRIHSRTWISGTHSHIDLFFHFAKIGTIFTTFLCYHVYSSCSLSSLSFIIIMFSSLWQEAAIAISVNQLSGIIYGIYSSYHIFSNQLSDTLTFLSPDTWQLFEYSPSHLSVIH